MITSFGLRHVWLVRQLQGGGSALDCPLCLLEDPATPLRQALRGYFLKPTAGISTYVLQATDQTPALRGFVQARARRPALPWPERKCGLAWDVSHIAPVLDDSEDTATVWYRLLLHLCIAAGEQRVQRLFARLSEESAADDVFRQAGFAPYCRERIFERPSGTAGGKLSPSVLPVQGDDQWVLQKLWARITPRLVFHAEECNDLHGHARTFETALSDVEQGYVLRSAKGETSGYVYLLQRPRGVWIRLMAQPEARDGPAEMLDHALAVLGDSPRPLYCPVRDYEGGVQSALEARGFRQLADHSLLVKHTTVQVKESRRKLAHALEKRAEVAPTVSRSQEALVRSLEQKPSVGKGDQR